MGEGEGERRAGRIVPIGILHTRTPRLAVGRSLRGTTTVGSNVSKMINMMKVIKVMTMAKVAS